MADLQTDYGALTAQWRDTEGSARRDTHESPAVVLLQRRLPGVEHWRTVCPYPVEHDALARLTAKTLQTMWPGTALRVIEPGGKVLRVWDGRQWVRAL